MSSDNSVTTESGTFTMYSGWLTRCQAKNKCKSLGQILAPIQKKSDLTAIQNLFKNNSNQCVHHFSPVYGYHIGLEVENVGGTVVKKEFSNGQKWDKCEEYADMYWFTPQKNMCPLASFTPFPDPLGVEPENSDCSPRRQRYICFSPAKTSTEMPEPLKTQQDSTEVFHLPGAFAALSLIVNVVCVLISISMKRNNSKLEKKMNALDVENLN